MPKERGPDLKTKFSERRAPWCDHDWKVAEPLDLQQQHELTVVQLRETQLRLAEIRAQLNAKRAEAARLRKALRLEREETASLRKRLEALEQLHYQLPATIGHEFRTPLSIIQGWSEYLLDLPGRCAGDVEPLSEILKSTRDLSRKVDRSVMLSQALSGQLAIDPQPIALEEALERALCAHSDQIREMGLNVEQKAPPKTALVVFDGECLDAILLALIENAVKFNHPGGSIRVKIQQHRGSVSLSIHNTGVGIPPDRLDHVFSPFNQVEIGSTRRFGGLGLGLPLVRELLENSGASIQASSKGAERGATFIVSLPGASRQLV